MWFLEQLGQLLELLGRAIRYLLRILFQALWLAGLAGLLAGLLTPVAWWLIRVSGLLEPLLLAVNPRLSLLDVMAGLFGTAVGLATAYFLRNYTGTGKGWFVVCAVGGFPGGYLSSLMFFSIVALF